MWTSRIEELTDRRGLKCFLYFDAAPVAYLEVLDRWQNDAGFRSYFVGILSNAPYPAFRWETPPITNDTSGRPFEFVLLDSPGLAVRPDPNVFAEHFQAAEADVLEFSNLGKGAIMIVPCPRASGSAYGHLAAFVRGAPQNQYICWG
jgi:hypothetical protein